MIPSQNIIAWGSVVPWADQRQIEQDLIISRALIDISTITCWAPNFVFAAARR